MGKKLPYKYCIVPCCMSSTVKTPEKTFLHVPPDPTRRRVWINAMKRAMRISPTASLWCCEDHFSLPDDVENYWQWKLTSDVKRIKLKPDVVPHIFDCQSKRPSVVEKQAARTRTKELLTTDGKCDGDSNIKGSGVPQEEKVDKIPLKTIFVIKEEPRDDYPTTSTSTATAPTASEEFILPHEDSSNIEPKPVAESQLTLSVACLAPDTNEQSSKKRKANNLKTVTHVPSTNDLPASDEHDLGELSNPGSSKSKDQFDIYGEYIAAKLRNLDLVSCAFAQKAIGDVIFEAELGKYRKQMDNVKS